MEEKKLQEQIDQLNHKMDILLDYVQQQNYRAEKVDDLISDVSIIGKDFYDSSVELLDKHAVEINPDEVRLLLLKFLRNVNNISNIFDTLESITDLIKDAAPIANEVIIDIAKKLHEFEQKGYFEFVRGIGKVIDTVITHYSKEDLNKIAENIPVALNILKNVADTKLLSIMNNAIIEFNNLDANKVEKYSLFQLMKEMNSREMKQAMGFAITFVKNISNKNQ